MLFVDSLQVFNFAGNVAAPVMGFHLSLVLMKILVLVSMLPGAEFILREQPRPSLIDFFES